jgi:cytochrome c551/c552
MAGGFALTNFLLVLLLMWTVGAEYAPEWKKYQREYYELYAAREDDPELKARILNTPLEVTQVWNPELEITDRCMTCHNGVSNPKMADAPQPHTTHPDFTQHNFSQIGCVVCHEGQGPATTTHGAHVMEDLQEHFGPFEAQHAGWERPLLPLEHVQASCNKCHNVMAAPIPGAEHLTHGWQLVQEKGCKTCHYIVDSGAKQAPELSNVGTKFYNEAGHSEAYEHVRFGYLKESMRCPQANMDHAAAEKCQAELTAAPEAGQAGVATLSGPELVDKYQCKNCHSLDAPTKLLGPSLYDIGKRQDEAYIHESIAEPDKVVVEGFPQGLMKGTLSGVGFYKDVEANPAILDALVSYLATLKGGESAEQGGDAAPAASTGVVMPNFNFTDDELRDVVTFLLSLQETTVSWPQHPFTPEAEGQGGQAAAAGAAYAGKSGEEVVQIAGCMACHKLDGPDRLVGPSLWDIGAKRDRESIRQSILEPDKVVVEGYPQGVMHATLSSNGFYQQVSIETLEKLVDYLAGLKGKS